MPSESEKSSVQDKILLVDDDPGSLRILVNTLEKQGYQLLVASNGGNALQVAARVRPALILLDVMMPDINGFEVCRRLHADPELSSIPIIFLSALEQTRDKIKGFELGAVDFITKPYQSDEVIARVGTQVKLSRLKRELQDKNRQLQATNRHILEAMGEGLMAIDRDGVVRYVNPAIESMLGWRRQELEGRHFNGLRMVAGQKALIAMVCSALDGGGHLSRDCRLTGRDGRELDVECGISPVADAAGYGGVLVLNDIDDRKKAERELWQAHQELQHSHNELRDAQEKLVRAARLETVGRLAAGVAHEVKNPLAVIQFGVDYLHQVLPPTIAIEEVLDEMEEAVGRADHIIKGMLDFSRAEKPRISPRDLNDLIRDSLGLVEHELQVQGIRLELMLSPYALPILADQGKIHQVMVNLFINAIQAMDGKGRIRVRSWSGRWCDQEGDWKGAVEQFRPETLVCCCAFEDSGPGIKKDQVHKVFDPFFTTKPVGTGTGLGLSVTANIIDLHQAAISLTNRSDGGACAQLVFRQTNGATT